VKEKKQEVYLLTREDLEVISILKAILAVMVVFIHAKYSDVNIGGGTIEFNQPMWISFLKDMMSTIITACAVPAFFLLSSIFLYRKEIKWKENLKRKFVSLIIPYFLINTFWILFYAIVQNIPMLSVYFSDPAKIVRSWGLREYLNAYLGFTTIGRMGIIYGPLWFVRDLFFLNIISNVIKKIIDRFPQIT